MYSHDILKRFVKDYSLPIQIIQEPYFDYFVNLYDKTHNVKSKLELLENAMSRFKTPDEFLHNYYDIREKIIKTIEETEVYKEYNQMDMSKFNVPNKGYSQKDIFNRGNVGKYFLSIDLKKANFQALKYLDSNLVLGCDTYEELIGKFTDLEYMKDSKYLRQVIFGNMNPKRQIKVERYIIQNILDFLLENNLLTESSIRMVSNDEIVCEIDFVLAYDVYSKHDLANMIKTMLDFDVDIEVYKLQNIANKSYFVKEFINKTGEELMCVPLVYYAQAYKKYHDLKLEEKDLCFYYEHQICKFMNPMTWEDEKEEEKE